MYGKRKWNYKILTTDLHNSISLHELSISPANLNLLYDNKMKIPCKRERGEGRQRAGGGGEVLITGEH